MTRLNNRTIIVTGAGQGIGAAYARGLVAEGAQVALCDILDPSALVDELGESAWGQVCDVADANSVQRFVSATLDRFGRIDGLVNNAAVFASLKPKPFDQIDSAEFDKIMQVNVRGTFEFIKAVMPTMRAQGYGKIVNIASGTFYKGSPGMAHYTASKGAVIALTRVVAREAGSDGIRVNCVSPGLTMSEGIRDFDWAHGMTAASVASRCIQREQVPEDLVGAVSFLLSADSDFISGQTIAVDGGSVML